MAEINVERKPAGGRGPLLVLLGILLLGALVWALLGRGGEPPAPEPFAADTAVSAADTTPVNEPIPPPAAPAPLESATVAPPSIIGDDTSGQIPVDTGQAMPDGRLGNP